jgi:hypothetical protein
VRGDEGGFPAGQDMQPATREELIGRLAEAVQAMHPSVGRLARPSRSVVLSEIGLEISAAVTRRAGGPDRRSVFPGDRGGADRDDREGLLRLAVRWLTQRMQTTPAEAFSRLGW